MKIAIISLALVASAFTMRSFSTIDGQENYYGNPWLNDKEKGECPAYERLDKWLDPVVNMVYATCMPLLGGNLAACPRSNTYDEGCDAYNTTNSHDKRWDHNKHFCVEECTHAHKSCGKGAECRPAPQYLQNKEGTVRNMCAYPKGTPPPHPGPVATNYYESPWIKDAANGACNKKDYKNRFLDEEVYKTTINGKVYGMCAPEQVGDSSSCPVPPNFDNGTDGYNSHNNCYVECSSGPCPKGSECLDAPKDIALTWMKKVCMYAKPSTSTIKFSM